MTPRSTPLRIALGGDSLIGILTTPASAELSPWALVVIVGGPQYRAGSHRQFTLLARACARAGFATLRFDVRGMGDSTGALRAFDALDEDIDAALDELFVRLPHLQQVVLWGLCDGASAALLHQARRRDPRVGGLVLLNPWVRSAVSLARTHARHYYLDRLKQADFWRKLLSGQVALGALSELWRTLRLSLGRAPAGASTSLDSRPFHAQMAAGWSERELPILLMLSGSDYVAKEFVEHAGNSPDWQGCLTRRGVTRIDFPDATHTFTEPADSDGVEQATVRWLGELAAGAIRHDSAVNLQGR